MYEYLQVIGFTPNRNKNEGRKLYVIYNPDGSPRWIWNAENPAPDFLRFYTIANFRAKVFNIAIVLLFRLRCQHWFFGKHKMYVQTDASHVLYPYLEKNFALFMGTEGPNRKLVLFANHLFIKVALSETSSQLIEQEKKVLLQLNETQNLEMPRAMSFKKGILALSDMGKNAERKNEFTALHAQVLKALQSQHLVAEARLGETEIFQNSLINLETSCNISYHKMPVFLKEKLESLAHSLENEHLITMWAHGDFTPWNCFVSNDKMRLYDFELANPQMPFGFDAFHFVAQQGILVERLNWKSLKPKLRAAFDLLCTETGILNASFDTYLKAYLFVNTAYYWRIYSQQEKWHIQISWLLNTWSDAISDLLVKNELPRKILIGDVFDFLHNTPYAAIKFPDIHPKVLSEYADIDLLLHRPVADDLLRYLKSHSLVQKVNIQRQSNMLILSVVLHDGSILALDLIWQLRRKALQFMRVSDVLDHSILNKFGIKILNTTHTQEYLKYFYGLNNSEIPLKYQCYFESETAHNIDTKPLQLQKQVAQLPENSGISGFVNRMNYLFDTLKKPFQQQGIIITFSGVDGAGKSTIIVHTKRELEKKLRKKVVVIRHRPSLLPILSAFTHGKEKAEQKAATTLPRQGKNKSMIGSLLRFAYYYTDYFFGQFYVYVKYVMRGDVVLYDRYYFDFINDSVRSNIQLPKWLTRAGYKLLLQPHLNFFLYADPDTILSRKKELDAHAIGQLTHDYLSLFKALDSKAFGQYFPIENLQLQETVQFIITKIQTKLI